MKGRVVSEGEFRRVFCDALKQVSPPLYVTGPGRSGAIASVYASHFLGVPFVPFKCRPDRPGALIVDTAMMTGATLRKASRVYGGAPFVYAFREPPRVRFWYEELSLVRGIGNEYREAG